MWWLSLGCLINREFYEERKEALTDHDGDGFVQEDECDDTDPDVHPDADEHCDGVDEDCDGDVDESPVDPSIWYPDLDGDTFGDATAPLEACDLPDGYVVDASDCDDHDASTSPRATETPYDGLDNDCFDGDLRDVDGDGAEADAVDGPDCDDENEDVHPGADEIPYDGLDQDCDGSDAADLDGDGHEAAEAGGTDCDDADSEIFPDADETWSNGVTDNDCDGELESVRLEFGSEFWAGESAGGQAGRRVSRLGDVDGDGLAEYLVGAVYESSLHEDGGAVYIVPGGHASGNLGDLPTLWGAGDSWYLGAASDGGPDIDGDGVPDLVVTATGYSTFAGAAWLVSGASTSTDLQLPEDAIGQVEGDATGDVAGGDARFLGDVMGDGGEYLAVSAVFADSSDVTDVGRVGIFDAANVLSAHLSDGEIEVAGYYSGCQLGNTTEPAGDVDGDGIDDYMVRVDAGDMAIVLPGGLVSPDSSADAIFRLTGAYEGETCAATMLGDVDGDGVRDLACIEADEHVWIFTELSRDPVRGIEDASASIEAGSSSLVYDLQDLGDLDGDGSDDTLVPLQWSHSLQTAAMEIVFGSQLSWRSTVTFGTGVLTAVSTRPESRFGYRVALSDDVDGDGGRDILVGGYSDTQNGEDAGAVLTVPVPR